MPPARVDNVPLLQVMADVMNCRSCASKWQEPALGAALRAAHGWLVQPGKNRNGKTSWPISPRDSNSEIRRIQGRKGL